MTQFNKSLLTDLYEAFNVRDIDKVLSFIDKNVHWPNGWEGGYVNGHDEVREYWKRQWKEIDPTVQPKAVSELQDGRVEVQVHQVAKDKQGNILFDGYVKHIYTFANKLIVKMEIVKE